MRLHPSFFFAALALCFAPTATAAAQEVEAPDKHRVTHELALAARLNPLGLFLVGNVSFKERLFRSESDALKDNHISLGLETALSPAFGRVGARAEFQPLTILRLTATYLYGGYFGNFGYLQSFGSPDGDWSDENIDRLEDSPIPGERNYSGAGHNLTLTARLQMKVSGFVIRDTFTGHYSSYDLRPGDRVYYDPVIDTAVPGQGWAVTNDLDAMWMFEGTGFLAGLRYNWTAPIYADSDWGADPVRSSDNVMHRLGPLVGYTLSARNETFDNSVIVLLINWYASHRFRTGADVSAAVPYVGLAFMTRGSLWSSGE